MHRSYIKSRRSTESTGPERSDHHRSHHRSGRSSRVFEQGDLRFVILQLIAEKPSHGYELIKEIEADEKQFGGEKDPRRTLIQEENKAAVEIKVTRTADDDSFCIAEKYFWRIPRLTLIE